MVLSVSLRHGQTRNWLLASSRRGIIRDPVRQRRGLAPLEKDGRADLPYSVAGSIGVAIAELSDPAL